MGSTQTVNYSGVAKFLHWLIAFCILFMLVLGWLMADMPDGPDKFYWFQLHKSVGITILILSLFRLAWRLTHIAPPLPMTMPAWEQRAARFGHFLLYTAMIVMPLSGWAMVSSSTKHIPTYLYGFLPWPNMPGVQDSAYRAQIGGISHETHGYLALIFVFLIAGHVAAAWKHHLFNRDNVLLQMAPKFMHGILHRVRGDK